MALTIKEISGQLDRYYPVINEVYMVNEEGRFVIVGHITEVMIQQEILGEYVNIRVSGNQNFVALMCGEKEKITDEGIEQPILEKTVLEDIAPREW